MDNKNIDQLTVENSNLREALTQVLYQNEMLLSWVKGGVVKVDRDGNVISANEIALASLGCAEEELVGQHFHTKCHHTLEDGSEYPWEFCPVFAAIEDGSSHHVTNDLFWSTDSTNFSADYIVSPVRDDHNHITGATLIFRNLTASQLQQAQKIHGMKLESIGELSAGIAHEINTPIQFIGSNISFLSEAFNDLIQILDVYKNLIEEVVKDQRYANNIEEIRNAEDEADLEYLEEEIPRAIDQTSHGVERVSELVLGLKGFAHSADNTEKTAADVNTIIENTLIVCRNTYKYVAHLEKKLRALPTIEVHHGDIGQVILNLIVNAAQAIEDNRTTPDEMGTITITSEHEDNDIVITVSDTGGGIPKEVSERIFDPFFTTKEVGKGSGQGLAIARNIVHDKHGGELSFSSKEGVGTTFILRLPIVG